MNDITYKDQVFDGWRCKCGQEMVDPYQANLYLKFKKLSTQGKMKVKIRKSGNSFVLTIPKVLRDLYNWKEGTEVDLRLNSDGIIIESSHSS